MYITVTIYVSHKVWEIRVHELIKSKMKLMYDGAKNKEIMFIKSLEKMKQIKIKFNKIKIVH